MRAFHPRDSQRRIAVIRGFSTCTRTCQKNSIFLASCFSKVSASRGTIGKPCTISTMPQIPSLIPPSACSEREFSISTVFFHCSGLCPGLGVPKNETLGCQYIDQAFRHNLGKPIFAYYAGICQLRDHHFMEANDDLTAGAFSQFTPAIDAVLRMRELNLGQRLRVNSDAFFASVLLGKSRDFLLPITEVFLPVS